jgi:hypothetical protein
MNVRLVPGSELSSERLEWIKKNDITSNSDNQEIFVADLKDEGSDVVAPPLIPKSVRFAPVANFFDEGSDVAMPAVTAKSVRFAPDTKFSEKDSDVVVPLSLPILCFLRLKILKSS